MIQFVVPGNPVAQPRHRLGASRFGGGKGKAYIPKGHAIHGFKQTVSLKARQAMQQSPPFDCALTLSILFILPRPTGLGLGGREPATAKPDLDNLVKGICDAMTAARVWVDDALVVETKACKFYGAFLERPCVSVTLSRWTADVVPSRKPARGRTVIIPAQEARS